MDLLHHTCECLTMGEQVSDMRCMPGSIFSGPRSGHQSPTLCITISQGSAVEAMIYQMRGVSDVCRLSQDSAVETMIYHMRGVSEELMYICRA